MASQISPLFFQFIFLSVFAFATTIAQVPANQTFKFINEGEFGDRIIEYDASYRVIRNDVYNFLAPPFRLCFYNTTPDAFIFAIRAGFPNDESLMRWVWDANRNHPVRENATLTFGEDGNFVLAEADGRVVWQTNTANKGVTGIKLLDNGGVGALRLGLAIPGSSRLNPTHWLLARWQPYVPWVPLAPIPLASAPT
ncbi:hypothetical protein REPUB_Repub11eG0041900 [Reevesia pubescens]